MVCKEQHSSSPSIHPSIPVYREGERELGYFYSFSLSFLPSFLSFSSFFSLFRSLLPSALLVSRLLLALSPSASSLARASDVSSNCCMLHQIQCLCTTQVYSWDRKIATTNRVNLAIRSLSLSIRIPSQSVERTQVTSDYTLLLHLLVLESCASFMLLPPVYPLLISSSSYSISPPLLFSLHPHLHLLLLFILSVLFSCEIFLSLIHSVT